MEAKEAKESDESLDSARELSKQIDKLTNQVDKVFFLNKFFMAAISSMFIWARSYCLQCRTSTLKKTCKDRQTTDKIQVKDRKRQKKTEKDSRQNWSRGRAYIIMCSDHDRTTTPQQNTTGAGKAFIYIIRCSTTGTTQPTSRHNTASTTQPAQHSRHDKAGASRARI